MHLKTACVHNPRQAKKAKVTNVRQKPARVYKEDSGSSCSSDVSADEYPKGSKEEESEDGELSDLEQNKQHRKVRTCLCYTLAKNRSFSWTAQKVRMPPASVRA